MTYKTQEITIRWAGSDVEHNVTIAIGEYEEGTDDDSIFYWLSEYEAPIQVGEIIAGATVVAV